MDDPDTEISPQMYNNGGKNTDSDPEEDFEDNDNYFNVKSEPLDTSDTKLYIPETPLKIAAQTKFDLQLDDSTESIKEELGLSSGITLQKIVRPSKTLTKLVHTGPRESSPSKKLSQGEEPLSITPLVQEHNRDKTESSNMVKITGKFSRKVTELVPLKKTVKNV